MSQMIDPPRNEVEAFTAYHRQVQLLRELERLCRLFAKDLRARGIPVAEIARIAKVSRVTAYKWLREEGGKPNA